MPFKEKLAKIEAKIAPGQAGAQRSSAKQDAQHAPKRLGSAPQ